MGSSTGTERKGYERDGCDGGKVGPRAGEAAAVDS